MLVLVLRRLLLVLLLLLLLLLLRSAVYGLVASSACRAVQSPDQPAASSMRGDSRFVRARSLTRSKLALGRAW